jgi:hypothetical protein
MWSLIRGLFVLLLCLVGIGLYRGWFTFSNPSRDTVNSKINISVSVDPGKLEADAETARKKIAEKIAQRAKQRDDQATGQAADPATNQRLK